jgi:delta1-piperideine-2-carboxylate reductase
MDRLPLSVKAVRELAHAALRANGCDEENAGAVATVVADAERDGCPSHGLFRLPGYVASLKSGKVNGKARPSLETLAPGVLRVKGNGGFAPLALQHGRAPLIELARKQGIAAEVLTDMYHFAALWTEVEPIVEQGIIAFAFTSYLPSVAPAGAKRAFLGTNPMAFGWPRGTRPPMIFDQASAAMARGEIQIAARDGHAVRQGVGIDADGNPTTDPASILGGAQLPFGGYKGSAIALMVELLTGGLIGESFAFESAQRDNKDGGPPCGGELLLALDPARFGDPERWLAHSEGFFTELGGLDGARLPGDRRRANREKSMRGGVEIPAALVNDIRKLAGLAPAA